MINYIKCVLGFTIFNSIIMLLISLRKVLKMHIKLLDDLKIVKMIWIVFPL